MVVMVWALAEDVPSFQATSAATDRAPVAPHSSSRSISATISTMRPSMALRCPANSANCPNNTSRRWSGASDVDDEDMTPSSQPPPTNLGRPNPGRDRGRTGQDLTRAALGSPIDASYWPDWLKPQSNNARP